MSSTHPVAHVSVASHPCHASSKNCKFAMSPMSAARHTNPPTETGRLRRVSVSVKVRRCADTIIIGAFIEVPGILAVAMVLLLAPISEHHFRNASHVKKRQRLPRRIACSWTMGKWSKRAHSSWTSIFSSSPMSAADMGGEACVDLNARTLGDSAAVES